jgi:hypothetical protein
MLVFGVHRCRFAVRRKVAVSQRVCKCAQTYTRSRDMQLQYKEVRYILRSCCIDMQVLACIGNLLVTCNCGADC